MEKWAKKPVFSSLSSSSSPTLFILYCTRSTQIIYLWFLRLVACYLKGHCPDCIGNNIGWQPCLISKLMFSAPC